MIACLHLSSALSQFLSIEAAECSITWNCCIVSPVFAFKGKALVVQISSSFTTNHSICFVLDVYPVYWNILKLSDLLVPCLSHKLCHWIVPTYTVNGPRWKSSKRILASHRRSSDLGINKPRWSTFLLRWSNIYWLNLTIAFLAELNTGYKFL